MKKIVKFLITILVFFVAIPLLAGYATMALWNNILISACGFAAINLWQSVGIFILGQIVSGGFILGGFFLSIGFHHAVEHPRFGVRRHWQNMTDEERKEFIERRSSFGFRHQQHFNEDAAEK